MAVQRTKDVERMTVELPTDLADRVKAFRFAHEIDSKVGAIRELIEAGLDAKAKQAAKK